MESVAEPLLAHGDQVQEMVSFNLPAIFLMSFYSLHPELEFIRFDDSLDLLEQFDDPLVVGRYVDRIGR